MLRVYLFGGLDLIEDEHPLPALPGAAARSLLAYLLTYRDRPHTRDLLAGTFWPDLPDATARRRLSQALWQIRRLLHFLSDAGQAASPAPPAVLLTHANTVQINPALPLWLDLEEFNRHCDRCADEARDALESAELCVSLYRGEFLAGYYDDWIIPEREGLRGKLLQSLERLLQGFKGRGEYERALAYARRLVAEDPWREEAYREVMRLCHLLGRDGEALKQYETCSQVLAAELHTQPSAETAALAGEIAARAGLPAPALLPEMARPLAAPRLERPDRLPLVGRQPELAELVRQLESAARGNGGLTIVYGEAGVGKSRLLRELAANAHWRSVRTTWGRGYELTAPLAYQPLVEALRAELPTLSAAALPPLWRSELARLLPELATDGLSSPPLVPQEEAGRLLEAIARAFLSLAAAGPVLLILEDAHWMDPASLEALRYLLPRLSDAALLIVVSARGEELAGRPATLAAMERTGLPRHIELQRLDLAETAELLQQALDLPQPAPRFSARLYAETEGNPFFIVETLWALVQEGVLTHDESGMWSTPWDESTDDYAELPLPASVVQSITRRLDRMPARLRELLYLAAVIGRDVDFCLWLAASGQTEEELLAVGDELCARGLLLASPERKAARGQAGAGAAAADFTFAHDLIRRVSYERLSAPRRRAGHRRVAEALTGLVPDEPAALAYHWSRAEVWDQAADYHQQAGDRARVVYANADAAEHYTQALAALERLTGTAVLRQKYSLHLAREAAYNLLGDRRAQAQDLQALAALAETLRDDERRAEAALRYADYADVTGDFPAAITAAQNVVSLAQASGDVGREVAGYLKWGHALMGQGAFALARPRLESAVTIAHQEGLLQDEAEGLRHLGSAHWCLGDYVQARDYYERSLPICRETGDRRAEGMVLSNLGLVDWRQGDLSQARFHFEQVLRIYREIGDQRGEGKALGRLAAIWLDEGAFAQAKAASEQALDIARRVENRSDEGTLLLYLGNIASAQGDYAQAEVWDERALQILRDIGDRRLEGAALNNLGELALHVGDYVQARVYLEQALSINREMNDRQSQGPCLHDLGVLFHRLGDHAQAAACYEQALRISREIGDAGREAESLSSLGLLAYHQGHCALARDRCRQALAIAEKVGNHMIRATVLTNLGHIMADLGLAEEADELYRQALAIRRTGGQPHLAMEILTGLARIALRQEDRRRAQALVEEVLTHLESKTLDGTAEPMRIYLTCYQVLGAGQDRRAAGILETAYRLLQEQANLLPEEVRGSFLGQVSVHQEIVAAYQELQAGRPDSPAAVEGAGQRITVFLPRADAPLGRPLRPDEYVAVTWTVHAPEDEEPRGKVARRRQRTLRLLAEAQAQGAAPRDQDLAAALGVSLVTLRRDMAALRSQGHDLPTRRPRVRKRHPTEK
jgi:DNA-binding SARP family transcriptional activator/tetratricopeptide (TPR) repeat protein/type II secretory pathway predicted ATPase ExeA